MQNQEYPVEYDETDLDEITLNPQKHIYRTEEVSEGGYYTAIDFDKLDKNQ